MTDTAKRKARLYIWLFWASVAAAVIFSAATLAFGLNSLFPLAAVSAVLDIAAFYAQPFLYARVAKYRSFCKIFEAIEGGAVTEYDVYGKTGIKAQAVRELFALAKAEGLSGTLTLKEE